MRLRPTRIEPFSAAPGTWQLYFDVPNVSLPATVGVSLLIDGRISNELALSAAASAVRASE